jgi:hypothetical protein
MTMIDLSRHSIAKTFISIFALASCWLGPVSTAKAETVIRHPGQHTQYSVELEPHLAIDWADAHWVGEGIGPGMHVAIPLMHQGPITTINNNMAIKFGLDLTFGNGCYWGGRGYYYVRSDCSTTSLLLPIALQWNFYLTDIITAFGEAGMAIGHSWWSYNGPCIAGGYCPPTYNDTYVLPYFAAGAKFMFGRSAGLTVRLGYPHITVGASILL